MNDLTKEVVNQSSGVLTEAYKDVVRPTAKLVGEILSLNRIS